ncbi:hypothetical protein Tco_0926199 [Tanacetum coccineum]|uniref:Uncharacterized protein n=1 Tax=Tanacetum coccineum TaxID=301880 RepID=A0ABQ5D954_9ASTR
MQRKRENRKISPGHKFRWFGLLRTSSLPTPLPVSPTREFVKTSTELFHWREDFTTMDFVVEDELRLCLEDEQRMRLEHEKKILEEQRFRVEEAKRMRLEEDKLLQIDELKKKVP